MNDRCARTVVTGEQGGAIGRSRCHMALKNIAALVLVAVAQSALAFDFEAPFKDPLLTLPPVIESGATLPGDSEPVPCLVTKDFSSPLFLSEAVDLALCNNPQIRSAWAGIKTQAGAVGEARAAYLPTLSASTNYLRTHTTYKGLGASEIVTRGQTLYGTLAWRIFDFGGREANREAANSLLVAAMANHDAVMQKALAVVIQYYFDAQTSKAVFLAKEQNVAIALNTLESVQRREARGAVSRSDTLQAATALAKVSLEKNRALGAYQKALATLVYVLGVPQRTPVILADDLRETEELEAKSLETWLDIAERTHPAIMVARAQWESAKQKITATRAEGLPTVDFSANFYKNGYPGQGLSPVQSTVDTVGIYVTIPLFDGFSRTYKIRGAEAQAEQREAELQETRNSTLTEVVKTYADALASVQNLQASEHLLSAAQESLNASQRRYEKGAADILEILNTQAALSDAQQERIRSLSEWRSARLRLLASVGLIGRAALNQ